MQYTARWCNRDIRQNDSLPHLVQELVVFEALVSRHLALGLALLLHDGLGVLFKFGSALVRGLLLLLRWLSSSVRYVALLLFRLMRCRWWLMGSSLICGFVLSAHSVVVLSMANEICAQSKILGKYDKKIEDGLLNASTTPVPDGISLEGVRGRVRGKEDAEKARKGMERGGGGR